MNTQESVMPPAVATPAGVEQHQRNQMSDIPRSVQLYVGHSNSSIFLFTKDESSPEIATVYFERDFLDEDLDAGIIEQYLLKYGKYPYEDLAELEENGDEEYYKFRAAVLKNIVKPYEMLLNRKIEVEQ
jgi:hypothetical protein